MRLISNSTTSRVLPAWYEENNIVYLSVGTDGTTGPHWIKRLEYKGFRLGGIAKIILRSPEFKPTSRVRTHVAVIRGSSFDEMRRTTKNVRASARTKNFMPLDLESMCLIREKLLDKDLATLGFFWLIGMHKPIIVDGKPYLLGADRI